MGEMGKPFVLFFTDFFFPVIISHISYCYYEVSENMLIKIPLMEEMGEGIKQSPGCLLLKRASISFFNLNILISFQFYQETWEKTPSHYLLTLKVLDSLNLLISSQI